MSRSLAQRLDDLANLTGFPQLSERMTGAQRRRHLRWLPIVALALPTSGLIIALTMPDRSWLGLVMIGFGNGFAGFLPLFGPVKPWGTISGVDERDRQVRRDAYFIAFATISLVAVLGLFALIGLAFLERWTSITLMVEMGALALYLLSLFSTIPTLHASWATRPIDEE